MVNIFTEESFIGNSTEQKDLCEYVVPFTIEDEKLAHNLAVLEDISKSEVIFEERILDGIRIGKESYNIKPTEVYTISSDDKKAFVTGKPDSANRIVFYAYPNSPQETLEGIDASPYLRVYKVELIMTRKTAKRDVKLNSEIPLGFTHSYPQINTDIVFVDWGYGDIPSTCFLKPPRTMETIGWKESDLSFVEYGDYPVVAIGRRNKEKFYGDRITYERLLKSIRNFSNIYGGLQPKEAYLQLALTMNGEYESNLVISI